MIAIKGIEKQTDCKKCSLMGTDGDPKNPLNPMMCIGIWATTRKIKHCIEGGVREDCPLTEIVTCCDCVYGVFGECKKFHHYTMKDDFCSFGKRRE